MKKEEDKLRSLFQNMKLDEPSTTFESKLMGRIYVIEKKKERREVIRSYIAVACGIVAILGISSLLLWILDVKLSLPEVLDFDVTLPHLAIDPFIISIAGVVLLLLIGDTLIRKRIREKEENNK